MTPEARELAEDNLMMAKKVAWHYALHWDMLRRLRIDMDDLQSIMYLTLCKAAQAYDRDKGYTFSTFFYQCARNAIFAILRSNSMDKRCANISAISLDTPIDDADDLRIMDALMSDTPSPEDIICAACDVGLLRKGITKALNERTREIVYLKYAQELTMREIAKVLNIPMRTVQSKLRRALGILKCEEERAWGRKNGLKLNSLFLIF